MRLILAHGDPLSPAAWPGPRALPAGTEVLVRARAAVWSEQRDLEAWRALPAALRLGSVSAPWTWLALPDALDSLLSEQPPGAPPIELHLPVAVQAALGRRAPRTWQRMLERTRLRQRGETFVFERGARGLAVRYWPAGDGAPRDCSSPLLALADSLARGTMPAGASADKRSLALLSTVLATRWLRRRLPAAVLWDGIARAYRWGACPAEVMLEELDAPAGRSSGESLRLHRPGGETTELDARAGDGLPLPVVRAALAWLLSGSTEGTTLYLDATGQPPGEPGEIRAAEPAPLWAPLQGEDAP